jgi:hypothetical protein
MLQGRVYAVELLHRALPQMGIGPEEEPVCHLGRPACEARGPTEAEQGLAHLRAHRVES